MIGTEALSIVKDFKIENTKIRISDDECRNKSSEDVKKILERIARMALSDFAAMKGE